METLDFGIMIPVKLIGALLLCMLLPFCFRDLNGAKESVQTKSSETKRWDCGSLLRGGFACDLHVNRDILEQAGYY